MAEIEAYYLLEDWERKEREALESVKAKRNNPDGGPPRALGARPRRT